MPPLTVFHSLGIEPAPELLRLFVPKIVPKAGVVLRAGEVWRDAWAVEAGIVRMYFLSKDGREFNKSFHLENSFVLPITPSMQSEPSLFYVSAIEATTLWTAPAAEVTNELRKLGQWTMVQNHLLIQLLTGKLAREHDLLSLDATRRYQKLCAEHPELVLRVPVRMLATYLGITDVSLSRIRRQVRSN